jgi:acetyltransferase-like isoleucine patch superfamily enzyme
MNVFDKLWMRVKRRLGLRIQPRRIADAYPQYDIGRGSYGPLRILNFGDQSGFRMGNYCSVAEGVTILLGGGHRLDWVTTYPLSALEPSLADVVGHPRSRGPVEIGHDVWLGFESVILSGVTIGSGAVIAARSVVTHDVPSYAIVAGSPAKVTGYRFDETTVARLLAVKWWDWPHHRIVAAGRHLMATDIARFLDKAEQGQF